MARFNQTHAPKHKQNNYTPCRVVLRNYDQFTVIYDLLRFVLPNQDWIFVYYENSLKTKHPQLVNVSKFV